MKRLLVTALLAIGALSAGLANAEGIEGIKCWDVAAVNKAGAQDVQVKAGGAWVKLFGRQSSDCYPLGIASSAVDNDSAPLVFKNEQDAGKLRTALSNMKANYELRRSQASGDEVSTDARRPAAVNQEVAYTITKVQ